MRDDVGVRRDLFEDVLAAHMSRESGKTMQNLMKVATRIAES